MILFNKPFGVVCQFSPSGAKPTLKAFVDVYATGWDIALGTGLLYPVTRDVQLDAGTYVGLSGDEPVATPFVGLSVRR